MSKKLSIRVVEYGVTSYWPSSIAKAKEIANMIVARNGFGWIEERQKDGTWKITHRFEQSSGIKAEIDALSTMKHIVDI